MGARGAAVHAPFDRLYRKLLLPLSHVARRLGRMGRDQGEEHLVSFLRLLFIRIRRLRISVQPLVRCSGGIPFCLELPIPLAHFVCELLHLKGREGG